MVAKQKDDGFEQGPSRSRNAVDPDSRNATSHAASAGIDG